MPRISVPIRPDRTCNSLQSDEMGVHYRAVHRLPGQVHSDDISPWRRSETMLESKDLVRESWACVLPMGPRFAEVFFGRLVEVDPQLGRALRVVEPREHGRRFVDAVTTLLRGLDDGPAVTAAGSWLDPRAAVVGEAFLWTLERLLGERLTPAARNAWRETVHRRTVAFHAAALGEAAAPRLVSRGSHRLAQIGS
jgi:hypothetical protein